METAPKWGSPIERLADSDSRIALQALEQIQRLSPGPEIPVPLLVALLTRFPREPRFAKFAVEELRSRPAEETIPALVEAGLHPTPRSSPIICELLGSIGLPALDALAKLVTEGPWKDHETPAWCAPRLLFKLGPPGQAALRKILMEGQVDTRFIVAKSLSQEGGIKEFQFLLEAAKTGDRDTFAAVADHISTLIWKIGKPAHEILPVLLERFPTAGETGQVYALQALTALSDHPEAIKAIANAIRTGNTSQVRWSACAAAIVLREKAAGAVPALIEQFGKSDSDVSHKAAEAIGWIGIAAIPQLLEALDDERVSVRFYAVESLANMEERARIAVPALERALDDPRNRKTTIPRIIAEALERIGGSGEDATERKLIALLRDPDLATMAAGAAAMGTARPPKRSDLPKLRKELRSGISDDQLVAAVKLGKLGADAADAVPDLLSLVDVPETNLRRLVIAAIGRIGPSAAEAKPKLESIAADEKESMEFRYLAAAAVALINGERVSTM